MRHPHRRRVLAILLALAAPLPATAQPRDPFDGPAILPQPFDERPFRAVRVPAWVREPLGCGYTLSVMDSAARARAAAHGVTLSEVGFVDPFYAYYDSRLLKRRSPHVPVGRLEKDIAEYKKLGVRVLAVYPPTLQSEVYETHPDWRRIPAPGAVANVDLKKHPHGGMLCLLGPYGDFFVEVLAEILTRFPDVSAFSFDGLHHGGACYCDHCRSAYRRAAGADIPAPNLDDPAFRRYQHWADRQLEDVVRRAQVRLKGIRPDVALVTWTTNAGRYGHFLSLPRNMPARMNLLLDAPDQEFWLDETNRGLTVVPAFANAYAWAVTNHRVAFSEPYLMSHGNPYGKDSFPPHEILRRMLLAATHGTQPSIAVAQPPRLQDELYRCLDEVQRRRPWLLGREPEPWAALLMSDNTRTFYGRSPGRVEERYLAAVFGAYRAALEEHLPVTVVNDWNLNDADLARYRVLILPNAACLDARQLAAVERFVRGGGGLVASLDTSLCDEFGASRGNFGLAEVFGLDHRGVPVVAAPGAALDENFVRALPPDYFEKRKGVFDFRQDVASFLNQERMKTYVGGDPVTFKGPAVKVEARPGTQAVGSLGPKGGGATWPAVLTRTHGKGRVAYLAAGLDAAYYLYAYPYQRLVWKHCVLWAAAEPPPVTVTAPMCVHAVAYRQRVGGAGRLLVHLFNDVNTSGGHALPADDVPLREEVLPIHGIRVTFAAGQRIGRVFLEPGGLALEPRRANGSTTVAVPQLDIHAVVVAERE